MSYFTGKKIWLIGASEGIGRAVAEQLAAAGATVFASARQANKLTELVEALPSVNGIKHLAVACDVTDKASVDSAWQQIQAQGGIDVMLYNAGAYDPMAANQFDLARVEQMMQVNFHGALPVLAAVIPDFVARRAGHIALVGSVAGYRGLPGAVGYGASKAALIHLAENLKCDLRQFSVKVQIINPGFVATRLTAKNDFKMPGLITAEQAAMAIVTGLSSSRFEIRFPFLFTTALKLLSYLPSWLYFRAVSPGPSRNGL